jgi:predicted Zn-dependent protease
VDNAQVQSLLEQFHLVAQALHNSTDQGQVEVALETITSEAEPVQMVLIKALAKESSTDAVDVLRALNEVSPVKEVRKEARRAMIQLEGARIQSTWTPPIERKSPLEMFQALANPPRFWKGYVTDSRLSGEVSLLLLWEQGEEYREVRLLGFLLDFWGAGVKDFFTEIDSKRGIEKLIGMMSKETKLRTCSLAKGKHLIEEALAVNKKSHTQPESSYRMNISLINQLIMEAEDIGEETEEDQLPETIDKKDMVIAHTYQEIGPDSSPSEVALGFLEAWFDGDFEFAYDLLAKDSSLREGLTKQKWVEKRQQWAEEAQPTRLESSFIKEHDPHGSGIWLPNPFSRTKRVIRDVEIGWSLEMADVEQASSLPELPQASAVYKEMGIHWFWTSYTLVKEQNMLRIQSMVDETKRAQSLTIDELQKQIDEHSKQVQEIAQRHKLDELDDLGTANVDAMIYGIDLIWHMMSSIYYQDAIIKKSPFDREAYQIAAAKAFTIGQHDRAIVYYEGLLAHFSENRAETLLLAASSKLDLAEKMAAEEYEGEEQRNAMEEQAQGQIVDAVTSKDEKEEEELKERAQHLMQEAEAQVRESLKLENTVHGHMVLAGILESKGDAGAFDEAVDHLEQALKLKPDKETRVSIEHSLGEAVYQRGQYKEALKHFQSLAELDPDYTCVWNHLGETYTKLNQPKRAEESYKKSLELHPSEESIYIQFAELYIQQRRYQEARELLERGLITIPDSGNLLALLASVYYNSGDRDRAEEVLNEAEEVEPNSPLVQFYRQAIEAQNQKQP